MQRRQDGGVEQALDHREQHVVFLGDVRTQVLGVGRGGGGELGGVDGRRAGLRHGLDQSAALDVLGVQFVDEAAVFGEAGPGHGRKQQAFLLAVVALVDELAEEAEELGQVAGRQLVALRPLGHALENPQGGEDGVMLVGEIADDLAHGALRSKGRLSRQSRGPLRLVQRGCRGRPQVLARVRRSTIR
ncbi:hypothetical protein D3C81_1190070 [compost metagenome]